MKRTEITYKENKNQVIIIKIENAVSSDKIREKFGKNVHEDYFSFYPRYFASVDGKIVSICSDYEILHRLYSGQVLYKTYFDKIVKTMKQARTRLERIKTYHSKPKTILI